MSLLVQITEDYKNAMRNREEAKKLILNFLLAQIKNKKIEVWKELEDSDILQLIKKEVKNIKEWITYLEKVWKQDDIQIENIKLSTLETYLPTIMSREKTETILKKIVTELWIVDLNKERWKIMWEVSKSYKWQMDGSLVNDILNHELNTN